MREVEEKAYAGVEPNTLRVRADPWIPGLTGIAEENDTEREQTQHLLFEELAPLHVEESAPGAVKVVGIPSAQADIGAERQLSVAVEAV